jgi:hypothetical protein
LFGIAEVIVGEVKRGSEEDLATADVNYITISDGDEELQGIRHVSPAEVNLKMGGGKFSNVVKNR